MLQMLAATTNKNKVREFLEILDELLTKWESMGYRFGTLEQLFGE